MASQNAQAQRRKLLDRVQKLAGIALFGTLSETYSKCGSPGCRCHAGGPKHGPYLHVSYRGEGKTESYHVPKAAHDEVREGIEAWRELQTVLRELSELNKQEVMAREKKARSR